MFYKLVNPWLCKVSNTYFYLEYKHGVDMIKVHIKNPNLHLIIVVSTDKKAMLLPTILSLKKMYRIYNDQSLPN
jgi:hypothetical protein